MNAYVCGLMMDDVGHLALVRKCKPAFLRGLLSGIGGKIERGELPIEAMVREWEEETGNVWRHWRHVVTLHEPDAVVYFYAARCDELPPFSAANDIGEPIEAHHYDEVSNLSVLSNLRWILPLAFEDPYRPVAEVRMTIPRAA